MKQLRAWQSLMFIILDAFVINISAIIAFAYLSTEINASYFYKDMIVISAIHLIVYYFFGLYKSLWVYAGTDELLLSLGGCITGGIISILYLYLISRDAYVSIYTLCIVFNILGVLGLRFSYRGYRRIIHNIGLHNKNSFKRVLVIGAGSAGAMIINEMKDHPDLKYLPIGLIDDNKQKIGKTISGIKVLGSREIVPSVIRDKEVNEIIIAIPSLIGESKAKLIQYCRETGCKTRILPAIYELIEEEKTITQLRDVNVEDLLGREPVTLDCDGIAEYIEGKIVMVTGGGGSIGSELCRQILDFIPSKLLILDFYENNAYELYHELSHNNFTTAIKVIIASVTDRKMMESIFKEYKPDIVFHAAAHKHVPLMEENPVESIKNNVFGTLNMVECARIAGTKDFVMISTDKAVNPTNIMGASKRICEMIIQLYNTYSITEFVAVRFGNVLGSNGSVIPLFKKQISMGGPLTVTDERITRYFMTIQEAVQLVLQAGVFAHGGEIFVLDMGKPMRIYDLAKDLIKLSGLELNRDIAIEIVGLRPGEKLYEELLMAEEGLKKTQHNRIHIARPIDINAEAFIKNLSELKEIAETGDKEGLYRKIEEIVPTYSRYSKEEYAVNELEKTAGTLL